MNTQDSSERLSSARSSNERALNIRNRILCALKIPNLPHRVGTMFMHGDLNDYSFVGNWLTQWYTPDYKNDRFIYSTNGQFSEKYSNDVPIWIRPGYRIMTSITANSQQFDQLLQHERKVKNYIDKDYLMIPANEILGELSFNDLTKRGFQKQKLPFIKPEITESGRTYLRSKEEMPRIVEEDVFCRPILSEDVLKKLFFEKLTI